MKRQVPKSSPQCFWVVFDGPPGPESGRFVEVEDGLGHGVNAERAGIDWVERPDGLWNLGPFYAKPSELQEGVLKLIQKIGSMGAINIQGITEIVTEARKLLRSVGEKQ